MPAPTMPLVVTPYHMGKSLSYQEYRAHIDRLLEQGKTSGPNQSPRMVEFTRLNVQRMHRLDKTTVLNADLVAQLKRVQENWIWLVLTEAWCGDAAQILPVIQKMTEVSPNITLRLLWRDENLDVMDAYLTHGGRAVPKLICLTTDHLEEIGTWGPRPAPAQQMVMDYKANPAIPYEQLTESLQRWYIQDKAQTLQAEFVHALDIWITKSR